LTAGQFTAHKHRWEFVTVENQDSLPEIHFTGSGALDRLVWVWRPNGADSGILYEFLNSNLKNHAGQTTGGRVNAPACLGMGLDAAKLYNTQHFQPSLQQHDMQAMQKHLDSMLTSEGAASGRFVWQLGA
jgi:hypothetical protein